MPFNRRSFLKALGLIPALPAAAQAAPLVESGLRRRLDGSPIYPQDEPGPIPQDWADMITNAERVIMDQVRIDSDGNVYIGGEFTNVGGVATNPLAHWDISRWQSAE
jgi:hypothetical protein